MPGQAGRAALSHRAFVTRHDRFSGILRAGEDVQHVLHAVDVPSVNCGSPTFFRHGFSSWCANTWQMASRPTSATTHRRLVSSVVTRTVQRAYRQAAVHRPSRRSRPSFVCRAPWMASVVDRRSAQPPRRGRDTASRRAERRAGTSPMAAPTSVSDHLFVEQLQNTNPLPCTRRHGAPVAHLCGEKLTIAGAQAEDGKRGCLDERFIHRVRSQLPIRGKHSDHGAAVSKMPTWFELSIGDAVFDAVESTSWRWRPHRVPLGCGLSAGIPTVPLSGVILRKKSLTGSVRR